MSTSPTSRGGTAEPAPAAAAAHRDRLPRDAAALDAPPDRPARSWYIGAKGWAVSVGWLAVTAAILTADCSRSLDFTVAFPVLLAGTFGMTYWVRRTAARSSGDAA